MTGIPPTAQSVVTVVVYAKVTFVALEADDALTSLRGVKMAFPRRKGVSTRKSASAQLSAVGAVGFFPRRIVNRTRVEVMMLDLVVVTSNGLLVLVLVVMVLMMMVRRFKRDRR